MHDPEKSDSAVVAGKSPNSRTTGSGGGGAKGRDQRGSAKHAPDADPGSRDPGAGWVLSNEHPYREPGP